MAEASGAAQGVTLDETRDFLYTALRAMERFAGEVKKTVEELEARKPSEEWLEQSHQQLAVGMQFLDQQLGMWTAQAARMEDYIASVRALADEMAIKDLRINPEPEDGEDSGGVKESDARFIHPELHRFKLEKTARIIGKYGGSPAFGGMVMPRLAKDQILKATASPAAREIAYSKAENKDAQFLAKVMQFKVEKKEAENAAWQAEMVARKGQTYLKEQQAKGVVPEKTPPRVPLPADFADKLAQRQAAVEAAEEREAAEKAKAKAAERAAPQLQGELANAFTRRQIASTMAAAVEAENAAEAAAIAAAQAGELTPAPAHVTPLTAEMTKVLQLRKAAKATAAAAEANSKGSDAGVDDSTPAATPWGVKLQARTPGTAAGPGSSGVTTPAAVVPSNSELLSRLQQRTHQGEGAAE